MIHVDAAMKPLPPYLPGRLLHTVSTFLLATAAAAVSIGSQQQAYCTESGSVPNIILILADDMGYSDIGCYGGEIETPTLDRLAAGGLRFTQFYNTGRCCPTRASLLTGLYPHQAGIGHMMSDRGLDGYRGDLNDHCATIAEVLRPAGYATLGVGKWHVTKHIQPEGPKFNWPLQRGFERFYGTITGAGSFFDPGTLARDNTMISPFADHEYQTDEYYYTDAISDHAVRFIGEHHKKTPEKPFFMYVAYTCAHWPMHALPKDIAKYKGRYNGGYDPVRKRRFERVKQLGLVDPQWDLTPQVGNWKEFPNKEWEIRCMEVYAAMIDNMDQGIGRIVAQLEKDGQLDNTLILFLQDNGGCQEGLGRRGDMTRPAEPTLEPIAQDAIRLDVVPRQNRAGVRTLQGPQIMPGPEDTYIAYGINWANVSNTPFREYKHYVHEGGISTPLIAHWPAKITRRGELESQPGHLIDLMATCVDLAEAKYPIRRNGHDVHPLEGRSLAPAFTGETIDREAIYWEHEGNRAMRKGKWKLVAKGSAGPWELYDMEADRTEMHDLADQQPERLAEMIAQWETWARRAHAIPWIWKPQYGQEPGDGFSKKKRFELKAGAVLSQNAAPYVKGKAFSITVTIDKPAADGVLVAQGGSAHGYSLYMTEGRPAVAIRRSSELTAVVAQKPLPPDTKTITAALSADRMLTITADGRLVASAKILGLLTDMPIDGLEVGRDEGGFVGPYTDSNPFGGKIGGVVIEVGK